MSDRLEFARKGKYAIYIGVIVGAIYFCAFGFYFLGLPGLFYALPLGAIFGAISGLDLLIPGPGPTIPGKNNIRVGPFRSGAQFMTLAITAVVLGLYLFGSLRLECEKSPDESISCSRITIGWLDSTETSRLTYSNIISFAEGTPGQILLILKNEGRGFIEGFDKHVLTELNSFAASGKERLRVFSPSLKYAPYFLWCLSAILVLLSLRSFAYGLKLANAKN